MSRKRPPDPPPGEKRPVLRRPKRSPLALDGYPEMGDWDAQQRLRKRLRKLGVDTKALLDALRKDPDRARFQREQDAEVEFRMLCQAAEWKQEWLGRWENMEREFEDLGVDPPAEVLDRIAEGKRVIQGIRQKVTAVEPRALKEQRQRAAKGTDRERMHHQIPASTAPTVKVASPFIRAVQKMYIGAVIRTIYPYLKPAIRKLNNTEGAKLAVTLADDPALELKRRVSPQVNRLIADIVRSFYPFWGYYISSTVVRNTLRNADRKKKAALGSVRA